METTSSRELWLARVLGFAAAPVNARATASWAKNPGKLATLPLAISYCQFYWQNGYYYGDPSSVIGMELTIKLMVDSSAKGVPKWGDPMTTLDCGTPETKLPASGGFGFLDVNKGACQAEIDLGTGYVGGKPGMLPCVKDAFEVGDTIVIPLFDQAWLSGGNAYYQITGWAALYVTEKSMNGVGNSYIKGRFVKFGTLSDWPTGDSDSTDYGVSVVKLTK